jgi:hypothetical protein
MKRNQQRRRLAPELLPEQQFLLNVVEEDRANGRALRAVFVVIVAAVLVLLLLDALSLVNLPTKAYGVFLGILATAVGLFGRRLVRTARGVRHFRR